MSRIMKMYSRMRRHYLKHHKKRAKFRQWMIRVLYSCELPPSVELGEGTELMHGGLGTIIHQKAKIGKNCKIYQNVTIAGSIEGGVPTIGDNVLIGAGAFLMGDIVIGDGAKIGANTVVLTDVPAGKTMVGFKGQIK